MGQDVYRYTTSPIEEELFFELYSPLDYQRDAPELSPELSQNQLTITMPRNIDFPSIFQKAAPRQQIFIIIYRKHRGASDSDAISYWQGGIDGISFKGDIASIICSSLETLLKRGGLRYRFFAKCRFYLADGRCPVPATAITTETVITSASGSQVSSPDFDALPDGYFKFGELTTPELESRFIVDHVGDTLTLIAPFPESPVNKLCKALAGCDYTPETCDSKFGAWTDDGRDCGCFDSIPVDNLFQTGIR